MADDPLAAELTPAAEAPPPPGPAPADAGAAQPARDAGDGLESLLAEFDRRVLKPGANGDARKANGDSRLQDKLRPPTEGDLKDLADATTKLASAPPDAFTPEEKLALEMRIGLHHTVLDQLIGQRRHEVWQQNARADFSRVLDYAKNELEGANIPDDYVEDKLIAEYRKNPEFANAWEQRRESAEAEARFNRVVTQVVKAMEKKARAVPRYDRDATEDREAVTAAVRGASAKAPPEKPPDFSRMSPAEFDAAKDRLFGG